MGGGLYQILRPKFLVSDQMNLRSMNRKFGEFNSRVDTLNEAFALGLKAQTVTIEEVMRTLLELLSQLESQTVPKIIRIKSRQ